MTLRPVIALVFRAVVGIGGGGGVRRTSHSEKPDTPAGAILNMIPLSRRASGAYL